MLYKSIGVIHSTFSTTKENSFNTWVTTLFILHVGKQKEIIESQNQGVRWMTYQFVVLTGQILTCTG